MTVRPGGDIDSGDIDGVDSGDWGVFLTPTVSATSVRNSAYRITLPEACKGFPAEKREIHPL